MRAFFDFVTLIFIIVKANKYNFLNKIAINNEYRYVLFTSPVAIQSIYGI